MASIAGAVIRRRCYRVTRLRLHAPYATDFGSAASGRQPCRHRGGIGLLGTSRGKPSVFCCVVHQLLHTNTDAPAFSKAYAIRCGQTTNRGNMVSEPAHDRAGDLDRQSRFPDLIKGAGVDGRTTIPTSNGNGCSRPPHAHWIPAEHARSLCCSRPAPAVWSARCSICRAHRSIKNPNR